jgi:hypothetical protein
MTLLDSMARRTDNPHPLKPKGIWNSYESPLLFTIKPPSHNRKLAIYFDWLRTH